MPARCEYTGRCRVVRGAGLLSRMIGLASRLPPAGEDTPLHVAIASCAQGETWIRDFDGWQMQSRLWAEAGLLRERLGLATFGFALHGDETGLRWELAAVRALGIALPVRWFRDVHAREFVAPGGLYGFEVRAALPLAGLLVHYTGTLAVEPAS